MKRAALEDRVNEMGEQAIAARRQAVTTYSGRVHCVDCDLMGHLNTARYAAIFDSASWRMLGLIGYRWSPQATVGWADVKHVVLYEKEVPVNSDIEVTTAISRIGEKSLVMEHWLHASGAVGRVATFEAVMVQFDLQLRRATRMVEQYRAAAAKYLHPKASG